MGNIRKTGRASSAPESKRADSASGRKVEQKSAQKSPISARKSISLSPKTKPIESRKAKESNVLATAANEALDEILGTWADDKYVSKDRQERFEFIAKRTPSIKSSKKYESYLAQKKKKNAEFARREQEVSNLMDTCLKAASSKKKSLSGLLKQLDLAVESRPELRSSKKYKAFQTKRLDFDPKHANRLNEFRELTYKAMSFLKVGLLNDEYHVLMEKINNLGEKYPEFAGMSEMVALRDEAAKLSKTLAHLQVMVQNHLKNVDVEFSAEEMQALTDIGSSSKDRFFASLEAKRDVLFNDEIERAASQFPDFKKSKSYQKYLSTTRQLAKKFNLLLPKAQEARHIDSVRSEVYVAWKAESIALTAIGKFMKLDLKSRERSDDVAKTLHSDIQKAVKVNPDIVFTDAYKAYMADRIKHDKVLAKRLKSGKKLLDKTIRYIQKNDIGSKFQKLAEMIDKELADNPELRYTSEFTFYIVRKTNIEDTIKTLKETMTEALQAWKDGRDLEPGGSHQWADVPATVPKYPTLVDSKLFKEYMAVRKTMTQKASALGAEVLKLAREYKSGKTGDDFDRRTQYLFDNIDKYPSIKMTDQFKLLKTTLVDFPKTLKQAQEILETEGTTAEFDLLVDQLKTMAKAHPELASSAKYKETISAPPTQFVKVEEVVVVPKQKIETGQVKAEDVEPMLESLKKAEKRVSAIDPEEMQKLIEGNLKAQKRAREAVAMLNEIMQEDKNTFIDKIKDLIARISTFFRKWELNTLMSKVSQIESKAENPTPELEQVFTLMKSRLDKLLNKERVKGDEMKVLRGAYVEFLTQVNRANASNE